MSWWTPGMLKRDLMLFIESLGKTYYCPLSDNRLVDDSAAQLPYRRVDFLEWNQSELAHGKTIKIKGFPIEQFHREAKQLTGIERCQCRKARTQRNHIACAILVWSRLAHIARETARTLYQVKQGILDDFLSQQLKFPSVTMAFA